MDTRKALAAKWHQLGPLLQRKFWRPLRSTMQVFHILPVMAAAVLFIFLATDGQFREIYISYLEGWGQQPMQWLASIAAAALVLALTGAVLSEAHYSLSTMRINVIYSSNSNPDANSRLRSLQRSTAFMIAFIPWLGLAVGLFGARNFVADRYCKLFAQIPAGTLFTPENLHDMQHLMLPGGWTVAAAIIFLGFAAAAFSCVEQRTRNTQRAVAFFAPALGALLFLLFTDWLIPSLKEPWAIIFCSATVLLTIGYVLVYQRLYRKRSGPIFSRPRRESPNDSDESPDVEPEKSRSQLMATWLLSFFIAQPEFSTGISVRRRRRQMLFVWAFVPWFLLALYFVIVPYVMPSTHSVDAWYQLPSLSQGQFQSQCPIAATQVPVLGHWTVFPVAMCCTIALGLLFGLLLNRHSDWEWRRTAVIIVIGVLAFAAMMTSVLLKVDTLVYAYRAIGPLGTVMLQLLFLISTFAVLAWLSQRSGFPVLTLAVLAIVICVMFPTHAAWTASALGIICVLFAATAFLSGLYAVSAFALILPLLGIVQYHQLHIAQVGQVASNNATGAVDVEAVKFKFECWLRNKGIAVNDAAAAEQLNQSCPFKAPQPKSALAAGNAAQPYPVFLIAAEGGGIYAASAASMFLGRLQEESPHFAEHVFAISGVSGGAIGSTIFQALDKADYPQSGSASTQIKLTDKVAGIMEDDHFSPVVGSIFPEIFGASTGRADTLVSSFQLSTAARDSDAGKALAAPFEQHWSFNDGAPALALNATWVETGFRVAFAPFHLHNIDEALYSFSDVSMPDESCLSADAAHGCISLIQAAGVSARFPLVLPPFSTEMKDEKRWNFVDGGYTDNSGATTALDLYEVLKNVAPGAVNLQIVLVTSTTPQPDLIGTEISGTVFRDTLAPIDAIMNVREDLGNDAVARACSEVFRDDTAQPAKTQAKNLPAGRFSSNDDRPETNEGCIGHTGQADAHLHIVEIQDGTYGLSLGWKISQTSFSVVSWMLGDPSGCRPDPPSPANATSPFGAETGNPNEAVLNHQDGNAKLTKVIVNRNSCVMKLIEGLVEGQTAPAAAAPIPQPAGQ